MKLDSYLSPYTKTNSRWVKGLNLRPEPRKLLEENIGKILQDAGVEYGFLDKTPKAQATKAKLNKWDYIKLYTAKWKKTFASHLSDKRLISQIHQQLQKLNNNSQPIQLRNGQRTSKLLKKKAKKYMKKCSTPLAIREMQTKTT